MSHLDVEKYTRLESPIHKWEPRSKILSLFVLIFSVALAGDMLKALAGLATSIILIFISKLPLRHVAGFMKWPVLFLLPFVFLLPFTAGGDSLFAFSVLTPSSQGLSLGLLFFVRGLGAALLALLIVGTAPFSVTVKALQDMGLPGPLTQIFLFAYRYAFLLSEELQTMSRSLDSKGFVRRTDIRTARVLGMALTMLIIRSYERSESVFLAMLSRGYTGTVVSGRRSEIRGSDILKSVLAAGAALGIQAI